MQAELPESIKPLLQEYISLMEKELPGLMAAFYLHGSIALGVLRQYYTFSEGDITSKTAAGEYGLRHLPARWHKIIREALNIRNEVNGSLYRSRIIRALEALQFLRFVIHCCNTKFA